MTDGEPDPEPETPRKAASARLDAGAVSIDRRDIEMLRAIGRTGSLHAAADALGRSYARMQRRVDDLETAVGPLSVRRRGGAGGGGTDLTENGRELLRRFERHAAELEGLADAPESVLRGEVTGRSGELATVESTAGTILAVAPPGAAEVEVTVRADAVVLLDPAEAGEDATTSLRNRFRGTVEAVARREGTAIVDVSLGDGASLLASVTLDSLRRLDLEIGDETVASFKATAARATLVAEEPYS